MTFTNCYEDAKRAEAYAQLEFANTYFRAYRDLPEIIHTHVAGDRAIDFGCGTGRSTRFLRRLGFQAVGIDISPEMIAKANELDLDGDYRLAKGDDFSGLEKGAYDLVLSVFTFDNISGSVTKTRLFYDLGELLTPTGKLISVVSSPEIYVHEWTSFTTKDYPENQAARTGDIVRIVTTDFADRRPPRIFSAPTNRIARYMLPADSKSARSTVLWAKKANLTSGSMRRGSRPG